MKTRIKLLTIAIMMISFESTFSQTREVTNQTYWLLLNQNIRFNSRLMLLTDQQMAFSQRMQNMQHLVRTGLSYDLSKKFSVVPLGYTYTWNYRYGNLPAPIPNNEHMTWQQVAFTHKILKTGFIHRLRLEERFIENNQISNNGEVIHHGYSIFQYRLRYRLLANVPIRKPITTKGAIFLNTWWEGFWSWGDGITNNALSQQRSYIGAGYQLSKKLTLTGGAYYQLIVMANGRRIEDNIGGLLQISYQVNLSDKP